MNLLDFWPTTEAVRECIPKEAESLGNAVFRAVHQPMPLAKLESSEEVAQTEQDLLEALLKENPPEGYLILPIVGPSGVGKSHLIRWLDLHIARENRRVIRIPKSTSLRRILEQILEGLTGPNYDRIRRELETAQDNLDETRAEELLLAEFRIVLQERQRQAEEKCRAADEKGEALDAREEAIAERHAPGLRSLLDGLTREALLEGNKENPSVFRSLVERVTRGLMEAEHGEFRPEHFLFPTIRASQLDKKQQSYFKKLTVKTQPQEREAAAALMNEVKDRAVRQLLGLGGTQLTDLFRVVREELLREGKELVLLVEDFTTLAGLQEGLLDVIKMEGKRDGKAVLCTLRTALAVTEGFIDKYDTIRTRLDQEWRLHEVPHHDPEVVLSALVDLVGAYLNAARLGQERLETHYATDEAAPLRFEDEADGLSDDDRRAIDAFGKSSGGFGLFPFNEAAVRRLAEQHLSRDGRIILNPRTLIRDVLRPTLEDHRRSFEDGTFPPPTFHRFDPNKLSSDLLRWLEEERTTDNARYTVLLGYWGDQPQSPADVDLPAGVYEAFGLAPIGKSSGPKKKPRGPSKLVIADPPEVPVSPERKAKEEKKKSEIEQRLDMLNQWVSERTITQTNANWIRNQLADMIDASIDWEQLLLKERDLTKEGWVGWIYLPHARGGAPTCTPDNSLFTLALDDVFETPAKFAAIRQQLEAMVRFHHHKSFDYDGGDTDRVNYGTLRQRAVAQAVGFVRARYGKLPPSDPVPAVAQALCLSARILNLASHKDQHAALLQSLFAKIEKPKDIAVADGEKDLWLILRANVAQHRDTAKSFLLDRVTARQGTGSKKYAVDGPRLLECLAPLRPDWAITAEFLGARAEIDDEAMRVQAFVQSMKPDTVRRAVAARTKRLTTWAERTRRWLPDPFDDTAKKALVKEMRETLTRAKNLGVFQAEVEYRTLSGYVDALDSAPILEMLQLIAELDGEPTPAVVLRVLSRVGDEVMDLVDKVITAYDAFLKQTTNSTEKDLRALLTRMGINTADTETPIDPNEVVRRRAKEVDDALDEIDTALANLAPVEEPA